jgi:predicted nucleotidyltransferase
MADLFTPESREATMERICALLKSDNRIDGIVLVGSMARSPDRWSDVDLEIVAGEQYDAGAVADDWVSRMYAELPTLHHYEVAFGGTLVRGFLLEDLLEIDLSFTPVGAFDIWGPAKLIFGRSQKIRAAVEAPSDSESTPLDWGAAAGIAWHDVLHAGIAAKRGRLWQGLWYLERVRNRALALSSERRGWYAEFHDYTDDLPQAEREPLEETLVGSLEPQRLLGALQVATRAFISELERGDPALADKLREPLLHFVDTIAE